MIFAIISFYKILCKPSSLKKSGVPEKWDINEVFLNGHSNSTNTNYLFKSVIIFFHVFGINIIIYLHTIFFSLFHVEH